MRTRLLGTAAGALFIVLGAVALAAPASAHVEKKAGAYTLTVGWRDEPVYIGAVNAVDLFVHDAKGKPINDIGNELRVVVTYGGLSTVPLALTPSFDPDSGEGTPGLFEAIVTPTQVGNYGFHFTGDINGAPIDETFTSGPQTFNAAESPDAVMFPTKDQTPAELTESVARLRARVEATTTKARSATELGEAGVAIAVALVFGATAVIVIDRRPRNGAASPHVERQPEQMAA